jgi:hypothetical protein
LVNAIEHVEYFKILVQDVSYGETCVTLHLIYRGNSSQYPELKGLKISIDITVGVVRSDDFLENTISRIPKGFYPSSIRNNKKYTNAIVLVPNRRRLIIFYLVTNSGVKFFINSFRALDNHPQGPILGGLWKPSFPSLERRALLKMGPSAIRCYCLFKLFVLLTAAGDDGEDNCGALGYITIDSFGSPDAMDRKTKPSSYALKTCVLRCIKKHPGLIENNSFIDNDLDAVGIARFGLAVCREFVNHYENNVPLLSFFDETLTV